MGVEGINGNTAYSLDGDNDQITTPSEEPPTRSFTAWVNADNLGTSSPYYRTIFAYSNEPLLVYDVNDSVWRADDSSQNRVEVSESLNSVESGWHFISIIHNSGTGRELRIYNENGLIGSDTNASTNDSYTGSTTYIGSFDDNTRNWNGSICEVRIYDHALTASEVQYLYEVSQRPGEYISSKKTL